MKKSPVDSSFRINILDYLCDFSLAVHSYLSRNLIYLLQLKYCAYLCLTPRLS